MTVTLLFMLHYVQMSDISKNLVTCPVCDGTGVIPAINPPAPKTKPSRIEESLSSLHIGNLLKKPVDEEKPFITCSNCRGFGRVYKGT